MGEWKRTEITTNDEDLVDGRCRPRSEATKAKLRAKLKGRKLLPEWIAKRSAARIRNAKGHSTETKEKLRAAFAGRPPPKLAVERSVARRRGKPLSPEHRAKLKMAWRLRKIRKSALWRPLTSSTPLLQPRGRIIRGKAMSGSDEHG